jgi:hypothetical protein
MKLILLYVNLLLVPVLIFFTVSCPGSSNWCQGNWFRLIVIYGIYLIISLFISFSKTLKNKLGISVAGVGACLSLLLAIFPGSIFWNLSFDYACPHGSFWGDKYDAKWADPFQTGLINWINVESEAVMFSILMLLYVAFFIITIVRRVNEIKSEEQMKKIIEGSE